MALKSKLPFVEPIYPDVVYLLYQPETSNEDEKRKMTDDFQYKKYLQVSAMSYASAHLREYFLYIKRSRGFDYTASCGNSYQSGELESLPEIHIYSSIPLKTNNPKIKVHDLKPILDLCPVNVFKQNGIYIPGLKAAAILYHTMNSEKSRHFILSDVDIVYYDIHSGLDPRAIYMCGLEFNPLVSFFCFSRGIDVFGHVGIKKEQDIKDYKILEPQLKIPMESQLFNNGIMHIPKIFAKDFFDLYYEYLKDLENSSNPLLQWPWPFWTAEMFATNYAITKLGLNENIVLRRYDPDVANVVHDLHSQLKPFIDGILNL